LRQCRSLKCVHETKLRFFCHDATRGGRVWIWVGNCVWWVGIYATVNSNKLGRRTTHGGRVWIWVGSCVWIWVGVWVGIYATVNSSKLGRRTTHGGTFGAPDQHNPGQNLARDLVRD
jgi:hypothetical protein